MTLPNLRKASDFLREMKRDQLAEDCSRAADALDAKDARIKELERALRKLVTECEAEFTLDGEWVDFEPLVKPSTINRARKALK